MDNFMDKLALRYNAGEMIKANSEADTAEMQNLQEQVEAYEAVLQEMRKLNYKNTELTEKMYSLVDESIEKVRTLQLEASENGANTELISREMSDAVTGALNEALNNMDSTVARAISESLATALAAPTEEIKQSAQATENVGNKVDSLKESSDQLYTSVEEVRTALASMTEASPELIAMIKEVSEKTAKLNDMIALVQATADNNREIIQNVADSQATTKDAILSTNANVLDTKISVEVINGTVSESRDTLAKVNASLEDSKEIIAALNNNVSESKDAVTVVNASISDVKECVSGVATGTNEIKEALEVINNNVSESKDATSVGISETKEALATVNGKTDQILAKLENDNSVSFDEESKNYITNIWNSVEATRNAVSTLGTEKKEDGSEEIKSMMMELASDSNEIKNSIKNIKTATDESKTSLKASFDSAIYGLKQDNKEMVEFMQRMNTNLIAKQNDPEKEQKEEEARQREEANRKAIEDRFKLSEDFMHKESVKVYRNVQAVINEKSDQQTAGLESKVKTNTVKIGQVKVIAIIAASLSGLSLVAQVLQIFGVL